MLAGFTVKLVAPRAGLHSFSVAILLVDCFWDQTHLSSSVVTENMFADMEARLHEWQTVLVCVWDATRSGHVGPHIRTVAALLCRTCQDRGVQASVVAEHLIMADDRMKGCIICLGPVPQVKGAMTPARGNLSSGEHFFPGLC